MSIEIERKFLLNSPFNEDFFKQYPSQHIQQGYLNSHKERTVRVRVKDSEGFLTIKGISNDSGISRYEFETAIPLIDAKQLLTLCEPNLIDKIRYRVPIFGHTFEVDFFSGKLQGLVIIEIELSSVDEEYEKPEWLGQEVTGNPKYYNANLIKEIC